jgi:hypothetical protein
MKKFLFIFIVGILMGASIKQQMVTAYKKGDFYHVCALGLRYFSKIQKNEDLVSLYAYSCLKSDYIDRLAVPAMVLKRSKSARRRRKCRQRGRIDQEISEAVC